MGIVKTLDDLREMVDDELRLRSRPQSLYSPQPRTAQYAPFRNPRIYQEDYVREVLGIRLSLNESYPWSLRTRLLIEQAEDDAQGFFSSAWDMIWELPGKILGTLVGLKDLMLNAGAVKRFAAVEQKRVKLWIGKFQKTSGWKKLPEDKKQALTQALTSAVKKIQGDKGWKAALGMVALVLTIKHRGTPLAGALGVGVKTESRHYHFRQLLLEAGVFTMDADTMKEFEALKGFSATDTALLKNWLGGLPPIPKGLGRTQYIKAGMNLVRKEGFNGAEQTDANKKRLEYIFGWNHDNVTDDDKPGNDIFRTGQTGALPSEAEHAIDGFIKALNVIAAGDIAKEFSKMWDFLTSIGSGAREGMSTMWSLIRKHGDNEPADPAKKDSEPGALLGPAAIKEKGEKKAAKQAMARLSNVTRDKSRFRIGDADGMESRWTFRHAIKVLGIDGTMPGDWTPDKSNVKKKGDKIAELMALYASIIPLKLGADFMALPNTNKKYKAAAEMVKKLNASKEGKVILAMKDREEE